MLEIRNIQKSFNGTTVLNDVSLSIRQGDFFSILGPSGCGKTTLLRIMAGFEKADQGGVLWKGEDVAGFPAHRRPFNMVFQRYALFPHMTVGENVAFGPSVKGWEKNERLKSVADALRLVRMDDFAGRRIDTLSGGQQQRVALARAIVNKPQVLLLDEPLSALDQKLREKMRIDLLRIQRSLGITFILVTHDQEEALTMSDKIAIMNHGAVEQFGSPEDIYHRPRSEFVADFIGAVNSIEIDGKRVYIRPEEIQISKENFAGDDRFVTAIPVTIREILFKGAVTDFVMDIPDNSQSGGQTNGLIIAQVSSSWRHGLDVSDKIFIRWPRMAKLNIQRDGEA